MIFDSKEFFQKNFNSYFEFLIIKYNFEVKNDLINRLNIHINKVDKIILIVLKIYFIYINLVSILFFQKLFFNLNSKKKIFFLNKLNWILFIDNKVEELFHALICIHYFNSEKIKKNDYFEKKILKYENYKNEFEFLVVGSGPGGSITASEIIKNSKNTILVDKGNNFDLPESKHPGEEFLNKWSNGGVSSTIYKSQINFSSGSCFGGGSEINSGLYHYPDKEFLKKWKNDFDTNQIEFEEIEKYISETKTNSGVNIVDANLKIQEKLFLEGASKLNLKVENIPRLSQDDKNKKAYKNSMTRTYLKKYVESGGNVLLNTEIYKISFINQKWKVSCRNVHTNEKFNLTTRYLFLCCGSIYTNKILLNSELKKLNFSKTLRNFKFHPMIKIIAEYEQEVQTDNNDVHSYQVTDFYPKFIIGNAASSKQFMLTNFTKQKDIYEKIKNNWRNMSTFHSTMSLGSGKLYYDKIFLKDIIATYNFKKEEKKLVKEAFLKLSSFIFSTGAKKIIPIMNDTNVLLKDNYQTITNKENFFKDLKMSSVHILGGVTMGESESCVADSFGKIKNYSNLYVNDSSLINHSLLKNPQGTIMSISLRNIKNFFTNLKK